MARWEKRDQDLYMEIGDNHMKINIMMDVNYQNKGIGLKVIGEVLSYVKADIRNPLRYLLITEQLLRSLSGVACTTPDTSKSPPTAYCSAQLKQWVGTCLTRLKSENYENIRLRVDKGNPQSYSFWDKNGFVTVGENQYIIMEQIIQNNRRNKI